jgi:hypothetical protein
LNGRGVANLDDALVNLELQPVHDALKAQLDPAIVRLLADVTEPPRAPSAGSLPTGHIRKIELNRKEFFLQAWERCEPFLRVAQAAYMARAPKGDRSASDGPVSPGLLLPAFRERLRAAMQIPAIEALFPTPWTVAARSVLPSASPRESATAMWGPVLGWCALQLLAESIDADHPERVAVDIFDRLRLREPFAQAFSALGFEGEEGWRVAARIRVVLLAESGAGTDDEAPVEEAESTAAVEAAAEVEAATPTASIEAKAVPEDEAPEPKPAPAESPEAVDVSPAAVEDEKIALSVALWLDPDVRWLTGMHDAAGHSYIVREKYEELLWWLLMPSLVRLGGETAPTRQAVAEIGRTIDEALVTAEAAGYRVDLLLGPAADAEAAEALDPDLEPNDAVTNPAAPEAKEDEANEPARSAKGDELLNETAESSTAAKVESVES